MTNKPVDPKQQVSSEAQLLINRRQLLHIGTMSSFLSLTAGCTSSSVPSVTHDDKNRQREYSLSFSTPPRSTLPPIPGTLIVSKIELASPYHRRDIHYQREPFEIAAYALSSWADTPAKMLNNSLVSSLTRAGIFQAVAPISAPVSGDYRLDTQMTKLLHDFTAKPSKFVIALSAQIYDLQKGKIAAQTEIEEAVPALTESATGGVVAANAAMQKITNKLVAFLNQ
jgi:ABC-type uncharacterized transport system auxiliary subunit